MTDDENAFIRWVAQHSNERGHNRYSQEEKAAFIAGWEARADSGPNEQENTP